MPRENETRNKRLRFSDGPCAYLYTNAKFIHKVTGMSAGTY